jgi:hypothetical protein
VLTSQEAMTFMKEVRVGFRIRVRVRVRVRK